MTSSAGTSIETTPTQETQLRVNKRRKQFFNKISVIVRAGAHYGDVVMRGKQEQFVHIY